VTGSNPALRSLVFAGVRTAISVLSVTRIAPSTTASTSLVLTPAHTSIPSRARGVQSRFSSGSNNNNNINNNNINNKLIYCHVYLDCWEEAKLTKGLFLIFRCIQDGFRFAYRACGSFYLHRIPNCVSANVLQTARQQPVSTTSVAYMAAVILHNAHYGRTYVTLPIMHGS